MYLEAEKESYILSHCISPIKRTLSPPDFYTTCCETAGQCEYMNNRFISSAWQGDRKGDVKLRFRSEPRIKATKAFLTWIGEFVLGVATHRPHTDTHTHVNTHATSLEQHVVQSSADGCQDTVGLVISSQQKMWRKKKGKKSLQPAHTHWVSCLQQWSDAPIFTSWTAISLSFRTNMVKRNICQALEKTTTGNQESHNSFTHLSLLTLFSYEWFSVFGPQFLLPRPVFVFPALWNRCCE